MATLLPASLDYTDKDFDAIRDRLYDLVSSVFPTWTDRNKMTFGNILVELMSHVGDTLSFYQDAQANESFFPTATQRRSIIKLAKLIGYTLPGQAAATVDVTIALPSPPVGDAPFPAGTVVRTQEVTDPVRFQLLSAATILAGANPAEVVVTAENSEPASDTFSSNGTLDQRFILNAVPFLDGSLDGNVTDDAGTWDEQASLLQSGPNDLHFTVSVDQNDRATMRFGDGVNGKIPSGTISAAYKTGGGASGIVDAGTIRIIEGAFTDTFGNQLVPTVTNAEDAAGGSPRQSVETAQILAPLSLRAPRTTVAREDYEIHAVQLAGVARALMLTSDQEAGIEENRGFLFIVPDGGGTPSAALLDAVHTQVTVTFPNTLTFRVDMFAAIYKSVSVHARVFIRKGFQEGAVAIAIRAALVDFFAVSNDDGTPNTDIDFGFNFRDADGEIVAEIPFSDIYNVVRDVDGVRKIGDTFDSFLLNGVNIDVPLLRREFPQQGTVTLIDGDTGLEI